ncbi:DUF1036 domain-containing protein [Xanthobacter autotrophicus DSM 431]|uniref:DUF1036 domain-containing protein n=1 Tax=Xanthobacter nonsaccharivorans TaxID=3119912 RepID=UPI00372A860B
MSRCFDGMTVTILPRRTAASRLLGALALLLLCAAGSIALPSPAAAELRLCNRTQSRVGVALGYRDGEIWTTEGWWNIAANSCETLLRGDLSARFYYLYAVDYDQGGEWAGKSYMCTREKEFTITRGNQDCLVNGYDRTGFFEVDTQEQKNWTVQLTEPARRPGPVPPPPPPARK